MTEREKIRLIVKTRQDIQNTRIRAMNRMKRLKDGSSQDMSNQTETIVMSRQEEIELDLATKFTNNEAATDKMIKRYLKNNKLWTEFLSTVKGVGPQMAAVIIAEIDIHKADTVSKVWQYAGMNSNLVNGKKKNSDGEIYTTDTLVRGDKLTKGFLCPYNAFLKSKLLGVLGDSFIKSRSPYRQFYDNYKNRLKNSSKMTIENGKEKMWKDCTDLHQHRASIRYMVKMFLLDVHKIWREIEGLPVRPPYQEEYLGHKHVTLEDLNNGYKYPTEESQEESLVTD